MEENKQPEELNAEKAKKTVAKKTTAKKTTAKTTDTKKAPAKKTTTKKVVEPKKEVEKTVINDTVEEEKKEVIQAEKIEPEAEKHEEIKKEEVKVAEEVKVESKPQEGWKKVETRQPESKISEKKPKKKHRFLKTIFMLIIILLILFLVHTFKNYIIISDLVEKQNETLGARNNYSFVMESYSLYNINDKKKVQHYHKDGKSVMVAGDLGIVWSNKETKELIVMNPKELVATVTPKANVVLQVAPLELHEDVTKLSFMYFITSEEVNGKECYKLYWAGAITWVEKETGLIVKSMNGKRIVNGEEYDSITEWKDYKFNKLTEQDVTRPNLLGYDVTTIQEETDN